MGWRSLGHPVFTGAVAVLAVNDHVFKLVVGGWWTGRLSDVAGVFVAAVLLGVLTGAPRGSAAVVGGGFAALKVVPGVAELAAPLLGGVTRRDPTDLVALAALVPAVVFVEGQSGRLGPTGRAGVVLGWRAWSSTVGAVLLAASGVVAVLATAATSCYWPAEVDGLAVQGDGSVTTQLRQRARRGLDWAASSDGGATWALLAEMPAVRPESERVACSEERGCFRVSGAAVEHRPDDSPRWRRSFAFSAEQKRRLSQRRVCGIPDEFTAVAIVARPDGDHVVVAMGSQGVLHLPPGGGWERRAVADIEPLRLDGPSWLARGQLAPLALFLVPILAFVFGRGRRRARAVSLVVLIGGLCLVPAIGGLRLAGVDYTIAGPVVAGLSVAVFVASLVPSVQTRVMYAPRPNAPAEPITDKHSPPTSAG